MQERYHLSGDIVTIGVQDVMFSHEDAERFFRDRGYPCTSLDQASRT